MRRGRLIRTEKLLSEANRKEPAANVLVAGRQARWEGHIGVESHERREAQRLSVRVEAVKPMRPASHDDHLLEPGFKRPEESRE